MRVIAAVLLLFGGLWADSGYVWLGGHYGQGSFAYEDAADSHTGDTVDITGGKLGYQFGDQALLLEYDRMALEGDDTLELYLLNYRLIGAKRGGTLAMFVDLSVGSGSYTAASRTTDNELYGMGVGLLVKLHEHVLFEGGYKSLTSEGLSEDDGINLTGWKMGYGALILRF